MREGEEMLVLTAAQAAQLPRSAEDVFRVMGMTPPRETVGIEPAPGLRPEETPEMGQKARRECRPR